MSCKLALSNQGDDDMKKPKLKTKIFTKISVVLATVTLFAINCNNCFAEGIGTAEVNAATENIKRVITSIAMPLGGVLIFASIVVAAIKMIANANNPQKRAESIGSLAWICRWRYHFRIKFNYCRNNYQHCNK